METGVLGEEWRGAVGRAPRSTFVPETVWVPDDGAPVGHRRITRAADEAEWWTLVDADDVVVTQLDDGADDGPGVVTSSASMPSLVATMLHHLSVADRDVVLDIGTGTGWTSALLAGRLGDEHVTTVEVDPRLAAEAAKRLKAAGFAPRRVVGDGLVGWPAGSPYDRIHSTAAVRHVPLAWIEQTRPGGVIVTPWGTPYANAGLLRLVVGERGQDSYGRFVADVSFMWMRAQRPARHLPHPPGGRERVLGLGQIPELAVARRGPTGRPPKTLGRNHHGPNLVAAPGHPIPAPLRPHHHPNRQTDGLVGQPVQRGKPRLNTDGAHKKTPKPPSPPTPRARGPQELAYWFTGCAVLGVLGTPPASGR
ncbi:MULTISPECIES: methyltransferase domain-containing protein [unclassified Streptomyces]|uniref:methyltransferase domain-containing protein n=1 Tax=unclassified Streptomyces TaxID=2593676 RepID=UPI00081D6774|nr:MULTISPECIES: methyltransferase domain-containing protein [unclassified Streptomyces]SCF97404.1 Protein-L-isoaspartate(D-aspartate) O-methyltransferase (PCMT) [Streptomyces sp. MnatMP-M17]